MAQDPASGAAADELPDAVRNWLADLAAETDDSQEELLVRLLGASEEADSVDAEPLADLEHRVADLERAVDETDSDLRGRMDTVETEFDEKIEDVRDRVIQVKREADRKAHENHSHRDLRDDIETLEAEIEAFQETVDGLKSEIESTVDTLDHEHEDLDERTEDLGRKLDILANALVEVRSRTSEVSELGSRIAAVTDLADAANRAGVREATCESCRDTVDISLLTRPRCPHCQEPFNGFEPKGWFFGSNLLKTGTRPALEGEVADESDLSTVTDDGIQEAESPVEQPAETGSGSIDLRRIEGIGSSYAERLENAGIASVGELATADPDALAGTIDVSTKLTEDWVSQARELVRSG